MQGLLEKKAPWLFLGVLLFAAGAQSALAQSAPTGKTSPTPLLQPIIISRPTTPNAGQPSPRVVTTQAPQTSAPVTRSTPGVNPISDVKPATPATVAPVGGILVETEKGAVVSENYSNYAFNPASNVKIFTAYAVLKTYGANYRFPTNVWTDGTVNAETGVLEGNLFISGRDPSFNLEHGVAIAEALNKIGIRSVSGDLVVTPSFTMNFDASTARSASVLYMSLDAARRTAGINRAWQNAQMTAGKSFSAPSVSISGEAYVEMMPSNVKMLFSHESAPMKDILKVMLSFSNNFMSEKLGEAVSGGTYGVARINQVDHGIDPAELQLATSSGLGINRVTPRAMMKSLRGLNRELGRYGLKLQDVLPVAGIDPGTLQNRFKGTMGGSVVGKTGTLGNTDGGVSSLSGIAKAANGETLFFVIFNQRGSVRGFRNYQDNFVSSLQNQRGGAGSLNYYYVAFPNRMANTKISYPSTRLRN